MRRPPQSALLRSDPKPYRLLQITNSAARPQPPSPVPPERFRFPFPFTSYSSLAQSLRTSIRNDRESSPDPLKPCRATTN